MEEVFQIARCTGHCCRSFPLKIGNFRSPMELVGKYLSGVLCPENAAWLCNHVVHLGCEIVDPGPGKPLVERDYYTCDLLAPDGSCGDYENRPPVCVEHPVSGDHERECPEGCTRRSVLAEGLSWYKVAVPEEKYGIPKWIDEALEDAA